MASTLQVRIDEELKNQAMMVYDQLGIDLSTAIRMFLKKSVAVNGIPFDTLNDTPRDRVIAAINSMRAQSELTGASEMTLDDINDVIKKARTERDK